MITKVKKDFKSSPHQKKKKKNVKNRRQNNQYD